MIYRHEELARFFEACSDAERALFATFLLTGFREREVMFLRWSDVNFELRTVRVTSKPELGFYPKRWGDREIPAPVELIDELRKQAHRRTANLCSRRLPETANSTCSTTANLSRIAPNSTRQNLI
jgi:integrase